jgi:hypothetical protein
MQDAKFRSQVSEGRIQNDVTGSPERSSPTPTHKVFRTEALKNFLGCGVFKFFSLNVIHEMSSRGSRAKKRGFPPTIRGNDKRGQPCPES